MVRPHSYIIPPYKKLPLRFRTVEHFLERHRTAVGAVALASCSAQEQAKAGQRGVLQTLPLLRAPKRVIWLTMAAGHLSLNL